MSDGNDLTAGFDLEDRNTDFFGPVRIGSVDGVQIAVQGSGGILAVSVGDINLDVEQLTEIYLGVASPSSPLPKEGSEQRIDRFLDEEGKALGRRYFLWATGPSDYPQLRIPEVRDGLAAFSDTIIELGIYEDGGLHLDIAAARADRSSVERDVRCAISMAKALDRERATA